METQPTVQSSEQHVAGLSAYFFGVVAETRQHGPFAIVLVPGVFQSEVIFDSVDGNVGGCDYDEFIGRNITDMQDGLFVGIFFLDNFLLGDGIIDPEFELNRLILILGCILSTIVIITNRNIVIECT